jgi:hypothetical protein
MPNGLLFDVEYAALLKRCHSDDTNLKELLDTMVKVSPQQRLYLQKHHDAARRDGTFLPQHHCTADRLTIGERSCAIGVAEFANEKDAFEADKKAMEKRQTTAKAAASTDGKSKTPGGDGGDRSRRTPTPSVPCTHLVPPILF